MTRTVVFVHGGWVTPPCWDPFVSYFEAGGFRTLAPAWPGKDRSVEAIREDPSPLAGLGIQDTVDHYERVVRSLDEPPILIGHSFGGRFTQILLDRGVGAAGIVIDAAAPKGVFTPEPTSLRAPLLLVAGLADRALPPVIARRTLRAYRASPARTELVTFPGRTHWIIAQPGWEEVADRCIDWISSVRIDTPAQ